MKVAELFERLSYGELSNLSISGEGSGTIVDKSKAKLILYTNDGLLAIFSRYILKEKQVIIETLQHITNYHFQKKYAESSGSTEPFKYIKDLPYEPFQEDVIKILEVFDSYGQPRLLNDKEDARSLFTPQPNTLQVPLPINGQALGVSYQARHHELFRTGRGLLNQDIDIPFFLEKALQAYIASKVYSDMNGQENKITAQEHLGNYEAICLDLETKDLINTTYHTTHQKLERRGFV